MNFVNGTNTTAQVSEKTDAGVTNVTFDVNSQGVINDAQLPVVYTDAKGNKVYKQLNGTFNTAKNGTGTEVLATDVIASMNDGGNSSTSPMKLANVQSSISTRTEDGWENQLAAAADAKTGTPYNAVNVSDLKKAADASKTEVKAEDTSITVRKDNTSADGHDIYYVKANLDGLGAMSSFNVAGNGTKTAEIKNGNTIDFKNGKNTTAVTTAKENGAGVDVTYNLADDITTGPVTVTGKDGKDGSIGINGKDGKDGTVTTIIKTIGKDGADGQPGTPGVDGQDGITRIVYQDGKDGEDGVTKHVVATLDDGLKYAGDNGQGDENAANVIKKKLNEQLDIEQRQWSVESTTG